MECIEFCSYIIEKEMERFNLDLETYRSFVIKLSPTFNENFDNAYNRCAFLYRYATCNMNFIMDCVSKFLLEDPGFSDIVSKWKSLTDIGLCSLSCGPGLDYLSFMAALSEHSSTFSFKNKTIISKYGAWRNTVSLVSDAILKGYLASHSTAEQLNYQDVEVIQADALKYLPPKAIAALQDSQVLLMVKSINLTAPGSDQEDFIKDRLRDLIFHLKSEALIFCIDTKPSVTLLAQALRNFPGQFLYGPEHFTFMLPTTFPEEFKEKHGRLPVLSTRGAFFVWQKMSPYELHQNSLASSCIPQAVGEESKNGEISFSSGDTADAVLSQGSFDSAWSEEETTSGISKLLKDTKISDSKSLDHHLIASAINLLQEPDKMESIYASSNFKTCSEIPCSFQRNECNVTESFFSNQHSKQILPEVCALEMKSYSSSVSLNESSSTDNNSKCFSNFGAVISNMDGKLLNASPFQEFKQSPLQSESVCKKEVPVTYYVEANNTLKPHLQSKTAQTDSFVKEETRSSINAIRNLTERIQKLVSSFERTLEVSNNSCDSHVCQCPLNIPNECANAPSTSANYCDNNNYSDVKSSCSSVNLPSKHVPSHCSFAQINCHCCANRLNLNHGCQMQLCHGSHVPRCCTSHFCRPHCEGNLQNLAVPNLVIPLQNMTEEALSQIISAVKMTSKPN